MFNFTSRSKLRGFGLLSVVFGGFILAAAGFGAFFVGKPYMDASLVRGLTKKVLEEARLEPALTEGEVKQRLFMKMNIQNLKVSYDNITARTQGAGLWEITVDMPAKLPLWKDAFLLLELSVTEQSQ